MDHLLAVNKQAINKKLDAVKRVNDNSCILYNCNDIIDALSDAKVRDKRLINDYGKEYVLVRSIKIKNVSRACRFFTLKGIERYLNEGKIYSYKNACEYFSISDRNKQHDKYKEQLEKCKESEEYYNTKKILKWLYEKRKSIKALGETTTIKNLLEYIEFDIKKYNSKDDDSKYVDIDGDIHEVEVGNGDGDAANETDISIDIETEKTDTTDNDVEYNIDKAIWLSSLIN